MPLKDPILRALYKSQWHHKNKVRLQEKSRLYRAAHHHELAVKKQTYYFAHREERAEYVHNWRLRNLERLRLKSKLHYRRNKERYRIHARDVKRITRSRGKFTVEDFAALLFKFGYKCLKCHTQSSKLIADHIIPICKGGINTPENRQPLCDPCNRWKGRRILDFRQFHSVNPGP